MNRAIPKPRLRMCRAAAFARTVIVIGVIVAFASSTPGCVVPVPHPESRVSYSRRPLDREADQCLRPGAARAAVVLRLGEPDQWWGGERGGECGERCLVYGWTTSTLATLWFVGGNYSGGGGVWEAPISHVLVIEFDSADAVKGWEVRTAPLGVPGVKFMSQLRQEWTSHG